MFPHSIVGHGTWEHNCIAERTHLIALTASGHNINNLKDLMNIEAVNHKIESSDFYTFSQVI